MEILIKTKQADNNKFDFLDCDDVLNPFYRHVTQLIKTAQYIPSKRNVHHLVKQINVDNENITHVTPVIPKIDISSTPYGKLVERFKVKQEMKRKEQESITEQEIKHVLNDENPTQTDKGTANDKGRCPSPASQELMEARQKMYEDLYQKYYPHYYQYYNDVYGNVETQEKIMEMSRDYAATSAANWIQNNMPDPNMIIENDENEIAVMRKMAEYVALKGPEFEQMMLAHNGDKFGFLHPDHSRHKRYRRLLQREKRLKEEEKQQQIIKEEMSKMESQNLKNRKKKKKLSNDNENAEQVQVIPCILDSYGSSSESDESSDDIVINADSADDSTSNNTTVSESNTTVCFKLQNKAKQSNYSAVDVTQIENEDDYDFTDHLPNKRTPDYLTDLVVANGRKRVSRFSPANPKNIIAVSAQNFDAQMHRKRKAAELVASKLINGKMCRTAQNVDLEKF